MTVKRNDQQSASVLAETIRQFRKDTKLTQAQLAVAIGIAPTSVYRYEAGLTEPDLRTLQHLYIFADRQGQQGAKTFFLAAMKDKAGTQGSGTEGVIMVPGNHSVDCRLGDVAIQGTNLSPREQQLATALVLMLRNNTEESTDRMLRLLLEPWLKQATKEAAATRPTEYVLIDTDQLIPHSAKKPKSSW